MRKNLQKKLLKKILFPDVSAAAAIRSEEGAFMPGYSADSLGIHQPHKFPHPAQMVNFIERLENILLNFL